MLPILRRSSRAGETVASPSGGGTPGAAPAGSTAGDEGCSAASCSSKGEDGEVAPLERRGFAGGALEADRDGCAEGEAGRAEPREEAGAADDGRFLEGMRWGSKRGSASTRGRSGSCMGRCQASIPRLAAR